MKYYICTISFRHQLISISELLQFATQQKYDGIELWGVHAFSLYRESPEKALRIAEQISQSGLNVAMISDYVDLHTEDVFEADHKWYKLIKLAKLFRTNKLRIFAGSQSSSSVTSVEWKRYVKRIRTLADIASASGISVLIETHPMTLADSLESTIRLMEDIHHPSVQLNVDFLHLWEAYCLPLKAYHSLQPWIGHFHFKNIKDRGSLSVFSPHNVYSPAGTRDGLAMLDEGVIDYAEIVQELVGRPIDYSASLEWFGEDPIRYLSDEIGWLKREEAISMKL